MSVNVGDTDFQQPLLGNDFGVGELQRQVPVGESGKVMSIGAVSEVEDTPSPRAVQFQEQQKPKEVSINQMVVISDTKMSSAPLGSEERSSRIMVQGMLGKLPRVGSGITLEQRVGCFAATDPEPGGESALANRLEEDKSILETQKGAIKEVQDFAQQVEDNKELRDALQQVNQGVAEVQEQVDLKSALEGIRERFEGDVGELREYILGLQEGVKEESPVAKSLATMLELLESGEGKLLPEVLNKLEHALQHAQQMVYTDTKTAMNMIKNGCTLSAMILNVAKMDGAKGLAMGQVGTLAASIALLPAHIASMVDEGKKLHSMWQELKVIDRTATGETLKTERDNHILEAGLETASMGLEVASFSVQTSLVITNLVQVFSTMASNTSLAASSGAALGSILPVFFAVGLVVGSVKLGMSAAALVKADEQKQTLEESVGKELDRVSQELSVKKQMGQSDTEALENKQEVLARLYHQENKKIESKRDKSIFGIVVSSVSIVSAVFGILAVIFASIATFGIVALVAGGITLAIAVTGYIAMRVRNNQRNKQSVGEVLAERLSKTVGGGYIKSVASQKGEHSPSICQSAAKFKEELTDKEWQDAVIKAGQEENSPIRHYLASASGYTKKKPPPDDFYDQPEVWRMHLFPKAG